MLRVVAPFHIDSLEVTTEFWYGLDFGITQALVWPRLWYSLGFGINQNLGCPRV